MFMLWIVVNLERYLHWSCSVILLFVLVEPDGIVSGIKYHSILCVLSPITPFPLYWAESLKSSGAFGFSFSIFRILWRKYWKLKFFSLKNFQYFLNQIFKTRKLKPNTVSYRSKFFILLCFLLVWLLRLLYVLCFPFLSFLVNPLNKLQTMEK